MEHTRKKKMHEWFQMVSFKERDHLENLGIDGMYYLLDHKREAGCEGVDWIHPAQYMDKRWVL